MANRNLFLNNLPVEQALERFRDALKPHLKAMCESVAVVEALDRVTGEPVFALCNSPLYDSAAMDGIAVVSAHTHGASAATPCTLKRGEDFCAVDTGDPVRLPYDAVIMAEDIQETPEGAVLIRSAAQAWQHVRPVGEDIVQGEMILPGGHRIRPMDIGVLLSAGMTRVVVRKRPTVAIIPTGTEMMEPGEAMREGGIIESNSRMFEALVRQGGGDPTRFAPVPDEYALLMRQIEDAARRFDMVLVCSGTSAGREDYTVHVLRELGEVVVHGVAMKPGKPVILAEVFGKPVVGTPGYPVSAYLAYENFVAPVLSSLSGRLEAGAPVVQATLARRLVSSFKYREYVRVKVGRVAGRLVASPLARGAGAAMTLVRADGFCVIDQDVEGVESGETVSVILSRDLIDLEHTVVSIGSHDLLLDVLADLLPNLCPGTHLSSSHVGSMGGLMALRSGEAHIAPVHLLDPATGVYNLDAIRSLFPCREMALIKGVGRVQGIMVKKGNPLGIAGIEDLPRCRFVNRQRGAGTRVLLDYLLGKAGVDPQGIAGYDREAATHMAVAASVRGESADAGLGILSAARAMDLDFIPVGNEEYDFAIPAEFLKLAHIRAFIDALKNPAFLQKLEALGGYASDHCGEVVLIDG